MSRMPSDVGDLIELTVQFVPPRGSTAVSTAAHMITKSPSGAIADVAGEELSPNLWHFQAASRINEHGRWIVRINSNAGLIDSLEFPLDIAPSHFAIPVP